MPILQDKYRVPHFDANSTVSKRKAIQSWDAPHIVEAIPEAAATFPLTRKAPEKPTLELRTIRQIEAGHFLAHSGIRFPQNPGLAALSLGSASISATWSKLPSAPIESLQVGMRRQFHARASLAVAHRKLLA
jgi:hypothetical protein